MSFHRPNQINGIFPRNFLRITRFIGGWEFLLFGLFLTFSLSAETVPTNPVPASPAPANPGQSNQAQFNQAQSIPAQSNPAQMNPPAAETVPVISDPNNSSGKTTDSSAETVPDKKESGAVADEGERDCLWGRVGEQTTYQREYSPLLAPDIPVDKRKSDSDANSSKFPTSPEQAITVIQGNGVQYAYYFKKQRRYRKIVDYETVFEPCEQLCEREIETFDPWTGAPVIRTVTVPETTPYPILHEKEVVHYEPADVWIRVIIPAPNSGSGVSTPDGSSVQFSTDTP